jgi:ATP-dependent Clp protease ATP-binding subunit ClpC
MFERFTVTARATLLFARQETTELGGMTIEAEHILLGLLRADKGPTPRLFAVANLSYSDARAQIRAHWGARPQVACSVEVPFSDETERILQYAKEEADRVGHSHIGTGHLLLGVLHEDGSFAAGILKKHGMVIEDIRDHIREPSTFPEPAPEALAENNGVRVMAAPFDAVVALERIRVLVELERSQTVVDEIHYHIDALQQHLA